MTKAEWVEQKKIEYKNDPRMHSFEEVGLELQFDADRKKLSDKNSGYFVRNKAGEIVDVSDAAAAVGYFYVSSDETVKERLERGGRLVTGDNTWKSAEV